MCNKAVNPRLRSVIFVFWGWEANEENELESGLDLGIESQMSENRGNPGVITDQNRRLE